MQKKAEKIKKFNDELNPLHISFILREIAKTKEID